MTAGSTMADFEVGPVHSISMDAAGRSEAPAVVALDEIHSHAARANASDIHIEPVPGGGRIRERVDGMLRETRRLDPQLFGQVTSRVKLIAGMDIADRRQPQDGKYVVEIGGRTLDARVSAMPTVLGEKLAIRLLDHHAQIPSLDDLGIPGSQASNFRAAIAAPYGFVVVCGPTGSGKTTTLYAAMSSRDVRSENLCSVEDPVEVGVPGVAQVQVNARAGVTFASALRAFLRQDPNVIMVGEMRDQETASVASSASLSGQLVLTTLHANDAATAIERLVELGISPQTIAAGLTAITAQRLLRRLCDACRRPRRLAAGMLERLGLPLDACLYEAAGCGACSGTGYNGRVAIFESIFMNERLRMLVAARAPAAAIALCAREHGYEPMLAHAMTRLIAGHTTIEELGRVLAFGNAS